MLFRDLRVTHRQPAATRRVDQRPGLVPWWILEGRAAGAAAKWLRFLASAGNGVHLGTDRFGVAGHAAKHGFDHDRAFRHFAVAISVTELFEGPFGDFAGPEHEPRRNENVLNLAAIGAAVHSNEASDGARDAAKKFESRDPGITGSRGNEDSARAAAATQRRLVEPVDLRECFAEADDHARHSTVADDEIGA